MKRFLFLIKRYFIESFFQFYLFVFGLVFSAAVDHNLIQTFVSFAQNYELKTERLLIILTKSLFLMSENCFHLICFIRQRIIITFLCSFMFSLVLIGKGLILQIIIVRYIMKWSILYF